MIFTEKDLLQLQEKGITEEMALDNIKNFEQGFPYIDLVKPATINDGIMKMNDSDLNHYTQLYEHAVKDLSVLKFVPASGAATRMFKDLFSWYEKLQKGNLEFVNTDKDASLFFKELKTFAFWDHLERVMQEKGLDASKCLEDKQYLPLLENLLNDEGLGYAMLPKGLLQFHRYDSFTRTATEEHLVEGMQYAIGGENGIKLHFTVSAEHRGRFINHIGSILPEYEKLAGTSYEIKFSVQKPSTDTLAVDLNNKPFRNADGTLLFRPGGHGALIQNLNELQQDIIFIKNIDNVVPDAFKEPTNQYKKALGGLLIKLQSRIHRLLKAIDDDTFVAADYEMAMAFLSNELQMDISKLPAGYTEGKQALKEFLDRPVRVCGMVENIGEAGGGPFWVRSRENNLVSLQIVESSQVDHNNPYQEAIFKKATHFNPVDLVCGIKNYKGQPYDITRFIDHSTGFISQKSKDGKELKAQELPGLWNGAMANWITLFVEVPLITFNPVKTVMDLLRKEHRNVS